MSTGFEDFKQLLTTTGKEPARSNLYGVDIFMPPVLAANDPTLRRDQRGVYDAMNYLADTVTLPGRRVTTSQSKTNVGVQWSYATNQANSDLSIEFVTTKDLIHRTFFEKWMNYTASDAQNTATFYDEYITNIQILKWELGSSVNYDGINVNRERYTTRLNRTTGVWQFFGAYPSDLGGLTFSNAPAGLIKFKVGFKYERYRFDTIADDVLGDNTPDRYINGFSDAQGALGVSQNQKAVARFGT